MALHRRILLGVDISLSRFTQLALHVASELLELSAEDVHIVVLAVIPVPYDPSFFWGKPMTSVRPFSPAPQQRLQAERVLRLAPCPVTLVVLPRKRRTASMVAWYKEAVTRSLHEHPGSLLVFTACDVAQLFAPPKRTVGVKEVEAAARALERLASDGLLCRYKIKGESDRTLLPDLVGVAARRQ